MEGVVCNGNGNGGGVRVSSSKVAQLKLSTRHHNLPNGFTSMGTDGDSKSKIITGDYGYVLQDVPHLCDYIPHLPVCILSFSLLLNLLLCKFDSSAVINRKVRWPICGKML